MIERKDLFGHALLSYFDLGGQNVIYQERDDGIIDEFELDIWLDLKYLPTESLGLKYAKGLVCDVGCGSGRKLFQLRDSGTKAIGIDISPSCIELCKKRGLSNTILHDAFSTRPQLETEFNTIFLYGNNIGFSESKQNAISLLKNLRSWASDDGYLFLDSIDVRVSNREVHQRYIKENLKNGNPQGLFRYRYRFGDYFEPWWSWLWLSPRELEEIAIEAGWKVLDLCANKDGSFEAMLAKQ